MQLISDQQPLVRIYKKGQEPDDVLYWLSRPPVVYGH